MATIYHRMLLAVPQDGVPEVLPSEPEWWGKVFLPDHFHEGFSFYTESCYDWIGNAFRHLAPSPEFAALVFLSREQAAVAAIDVEYALAAIEHLVDVLQSEPARIARALGYSDGDAGRIHPPLAKYSHDANLDRPGVGLEYLLHYCIECRSLFNTALSCNLAVVGIRL